MQPTRLRACPFFTAATIEQSKLEAPGRPAGSVTSTPVNCIGPDCQLWVAPDGIPVECGNCGIVQAPNAAAVAAQAGMQTFNLAAAVVVSLQKSGDIKDQIITSDAPVPTPVSN